MRYESPVPSSDPSVRRLVATAELTRAGAIALLDAAERIAAAPASAHALKDRVVVNVFLEPSTRTRISFELAARRLGATVITLTEQDASVRKG